MLSTLVSTRCQMNHLRAVKSGQSLIRLRRWRFFFYTAERRPLPGFLRATPSLNCFCIATGRATARSVGGCFCTAVSNAQHSGMHCATAHDCYMLRLKKRGRDVVIVQCCNILMTASITVDEMMRKEIETLKTPTTQKFPFYCPLETHSEHIIDFAKRSAAVSE